MATDPKDHPLHQVPDKLPRPPGDLPPSNNQPKVPQPYTQPGAEDAKPYEGEMEDENGDPVGKPPRL